METVVRTEQDFETALAAYLERLNTAEKERFARSFPNLKPTTFSVMSGKKYMRVVAETGDGSSRSSFAFIDKETGDIFKSASWKAPAKGARGSIYNLDKAPLTLGGLYR